MVRKVGIVGSSESHWSVELKAEALNMIKDIFVAEIRFEVEKVIDGIYKSDEYKKTLFYDPLSHVSRIILVSGGSPKKGVDDFAETIADAIGVKKEIYHAEIEQWKDKQMYEFIEKEHHGYDTSKWKESHILKGYRSRNIQIAKAIDVLYCIDPITRKSGQGGGMWTLRYAESLNKETHHVIIS